MYSYLLMTFETGLIIKEVNICMKVFCITTIIPYNYLVYLFVIEIKINLLIKIQLQLLKHTDFKI